MHDWFQTPPGQYLLAWEQARFDEALTDVFGYHALQLGLIDIDALHANRMPHRWMAVETPLAADAFKHLEEATREPRWAMVADATALPFAENSLDLVVLPHTLELSSDPHAALREVQRVLVHEGKVAITGLNPASLWGLRQYRARFYGRFGSEHLFLPDAGQFIGHWRLSDWLRLLEFELESISFGCYLPAVRGAGTLARFRWMDKLGQRWWPIFGAGYFIMAVKRTRGAKLMGQNWKKSPKVVGAPVSIANRTPTPTITEKRP
ncbi:class I SAM-dependent methyltransferase [Ottowia thiooxydans]|uniref:class I SAM-dependent methyltransferase n=1 Tax=Ottowia thiooxydans TaxID=219182 RepID=UPI0005667BD2|nr:class I SAM-dependent methyltransferase [Ottowia thiooxydans]